MIISLSGFILAMEYHIMLQSWYTKLEKWEIDVD